MDAALYFDDLPEERQPGLHVRRIDGNKRANDEEMVEYYTKLAVSLGDEMKAHWHTAYALAWPNGTCDTYAGDTPRLFVSQPSDKITPGYPLESLQIDPVSRRRITDLTDAERAEFWQRTMGKELADFIAQHYQ